MRYEPCEISLKDGRVLTLRSPDGEDAGEMLAFLRATTDESPYLNRSSPDEVTMPYEAEVAFLSNVAAAPRQMMLAAFDGPLLVGTCAFEPVNPRAKLRHRATFGIAVRRPYWGLGLGRQLLERALAQARALDFSQAELGVYCDNVRAVALYHSLGFRVYATLPHAGLLPDGRFQDEYLMHRPL